jgi:tRNA nucleotidyltransferase/poly(A) polymerase
VAFTRDWAADAARRDFTINALYAAADGQVIDPLGGLADIAARRVRFINSARERIREDYLRILRFFRFTADYSDGRADADGLAACIIERAGLERLSAERIRTEMLRILVTRKPMAAIEPMAETGLLVSLLGGVVYPAHFERLVALEAMLGGLPVPIRRLAALAVRIEEDAMRLRGRLRLSNNEAARLDTMAAYAPAMHAESEERRAREALYRLGRTAFEDRVLIAWARSSDVAENEAWRRLYALPERWTPPCFAIKGQDAAGRGFKPGPQMGAALRALEEKWIASDFALSREELLAALERP